MTLESTHAIVNAAAEAGRGAGAFNVIQIELAEADLRECGEIPREPGADRARDFGNRPGLGVPSRCAP